MWERSIGNVCLSVEENQSDDWTRQSISWDSSSMFINSSLIAATHWASINRFIRFKGAAGTNWIQPVRVSAGADGRWSDSEIVVCTVLIPLAAFGWNCHLATAEGLDRSLNICHKPLNNRKFTVKTVPYTISVSLYMKRTEYFEKSRKTS